MKRRREYVFDAIAVVNLDENTLELYDWWEGRLERLPAGGMKFKRVIVYHGLGDAEEESKLLCAILGQGGGEEDAK